MKIKLSFLILCSSVILFIGSCSNEPNTPTPLEPFIEIDQKFLNLKFNEEAKNLEIEVNASEEWEITKVSSTGDWLNAETMEKSKLNIQVKQNTSSDERTGIVTIGLKKDANVKIGINVVQAPSPTKGVLKIDEKLLNVEFDRSANIIEIKVESNNEWEVTKVSADGDWLNAETMEKSKLKISVGQNNSSSERVGIVTIALKEYTDISIDITVTQSASTSSERLFSHIEDFIEVFKDFTLKPADVDNYEKNNFKSVLTIDEEEPFYDSLSRRYDRGIDSDLIPRSGYIFLVSVNYYLYCPCLYVDIKHKDLIYNEESKILNDSFVELLAALSFEYVDTGGVIPERNRHDFYSKKLELDLTVEINQILEPYDTDDHIGIALYEPM